VGFPFILEGLFDRGKSGFLFLSRGWALELDYSKPLKQSTLSYLLKKTLLSITLWKEEILSELIR
jgi:hypothetical protein